MSIEAIQQEIIEEFSFFGEWMEKYEYLIELGKGLPMIDDQYKTDDHLIRGCQSRVGCMPIWKMIGCLYCRF
ncbi:MAG: SufE family protein [Saprospiraceae bacterium]